MLCFQFAAERRVLPAASSPRDPIFFFPLGTRDVGRGILVDRQAGRQAGRKEGWLAGGRLSDDLGISVRYHGTSRDGRPRGVKPNGQLLTVIERQTFSATMWPIFLETSDGSTYHSYETGSAEHDFVPFAFKFIVKNNPRFELTHSVESQPELALCAVNSPDGNRAVSSGRRNVNGGLRRAVMPPRGFLVTRWRDRPREEHSSDRSRLASRSQERMRTGDQIFRCHHVTFGYLRVLSSERLLVIGPHFGEIDGAAR